MYKKVVALIAIALLTFGCEGDTTRYIKLIDSNKTKVAENKADEQVESSTVNNVPQEIQNTTVAEDIINVVSITNESNDTIQKDNNLTVQNSSSSDDITDTTADVPVQENNSSIQETFAYETQSSVKIKLNFPDANHQKQVSFYESKDKVVKTEAGDYLDFNALLHRGIAKSTVYETEITIGGHVEELWIVIPALLYEEKNAIINNQIELSF